MATKPNTEVAVPEEIPEYLKQYQVPSTDAESLAGLSNKIPRISLRGRKFRLVVDGEEIVKPSDQLDVIILAVEPEKGKMVKTFYMKGYNPSETAPPDCSSANGITPDSWVQQPQNPSCNTCPKNAFGSATSNTGKPSKACKDSKRLWVAVPGDHDPDLKLGADGTVFSLGVPVTSLSSLSEFGKNIAKNGYPLPAVITHMEMADSEFPQIEFSFKGFLPESSGKIAIERNISRDWMLPVSSGPAITNETKKTPSIADATKEAATKSSTGDDGSKKGDTDSVIGNW